MLATPAEQIISIPHSGTRSLMKHLGIDTFQHWQENIGWIFGAPVHVPMRNPMSVAESWARRLRSLEDLRHRYQVMMGALWHGNMQVHRMEDITALVPSDPAECRTDNRTLVKHYQSVICADVVIPNLDRFTQWYDESDLLPDD